MVFYMHKTTPQPKYDMQPLIFIGIFILAALLFFAEKYPAFLSYPLGRVLFSLVVFNTAALPFSYKL
jgi:hypothetical protein